jgi:hypothetical protein
VRRVGCTGHQNVTGPTRRKVAAALALELDRFEEDQLVGYTSLAEGADQLFAFAVLAAGGRIHAVIPSGDYESSFQSADALATYTALLTLSSDRHTLPFEKPTEDAYLAAGREVADCCDVLLAVWDGAGAAGKGGTADVVAYARTRGIDVQVIWPTGAVRG